MLKEIMRNPNKKIKLIIFTLILCGTIVFLILFSIQNINHKNRKEFQAVAGNWKVAEYLGEAVEYHGVDDNADAEGIRDDKEDIEIKKSFLNKKLSINKKNVMQFSAPSELGYYYSDWSELYHLYRQPPNKLDILLPPFLCITFKLKNHEESLDIIMDSHGSTVLEVNGEFFRLEKVY